MSQDFASIQKKLIVRYCQSLYPEFDEEAVIFQCMKAVKEGKWVLLYGFPYDKKLDEEEEDNSLQLDSILDPKHRATLIYLSSLLCEKKGKDVYISLMPSSDIDEETLQTGYIYEETPRSEEVCSHVAMFSIIHHYHLRGV